LLISYRSLSERGSEVGLCTSEDGYRRKITHLPTMPSSTSGQENMGGKHSKFPCCRKFSCTKTLVDMAAILCRRMATFALCALFGAQATHCKGGPADQIGWISDTQSAKVPSPTHISVYARGMAIWAPQPKGFCQSWVRRCEASCCYLVSDR
jgi:hypothetical protein